MENLEQQLMSAKEASRQLRTATTEQKNLFLQDLSALLLKHTSDILTENQKDVEAAGQLTDAMKKRLTLTEKSIESIALGVKSVAELSDPVGTIVKMWKRPNGM